MTPCDSLWSTPEGVPKVSWQKTSGFCGSSFAIHAPSSMHSHSIRPFGNSYAAQTASPCTNLLIPHQNDARIAPRPQAHRAGRNCGRNGSFVAKRCVIPAADTSINHSNIGSGECYLTRRLSPGSKKFILLPLCNLMVRGRR